MDSIRDIANQVLAAKPDAAVRVRLLRDVFHSPADRPELIRAENDLSRSCGVSRLKSEQRQDGSWGRFHSADSRLKQSIPTTEYGVARAKSIGLDDSHPILQRAINYIACLLEGQIEFPDPAEKNARWPTGIRLFTAATLALVRPEHAALSRSLELWAAITERTFASGMYDSDAEDQVHIQLTGVSVRNTYLALHNRYQLILLSSRPHLLSSRTERCLLDWICRRQNGIGYLSIALSPFEAGSRASQIEHWFTSWEIISRFSSWREHAEKMIQWVWKQRNQNDFWDFGPRAFHTAFLPLSENWQAQNARVLDWTTRTLLLLEEFHK